MCVAEVKAALLLVTTLLVLCYVLPVNDYMRLLVDWMASLNVVVGSFVFMAVYAVVVVSFLPAMVLSIAAGFLWGFWRSLLLVETGASVLARVRATSARARVARVGNVVVFFVFLLRF